MEKVLCGIWQEVLGVERVGLNDDFFRIGGDSILAIRLSHRMSKVLGCEVKVADIFISKSIRLLIDNVTVLKVDNENIEKKF
jgi:hypothetical protein